MNGLGDSIYQRPFVKALARSWEVYLTTSWPQLYSDIPGLHFVHHHLKLRTQEKNVRKLPPETYTTAPKGIRRQYLGYDLRDPKDNILTGLERMARVRGPLVMDLPELPPSPIVADRPIAVVRPVTERGEWLNRARNCHPRYVHDAAAILQRQGFFVVSVADLQTGIEVAFNPLPPADLRLHRGELGILDLLALVRDAAVVVGPIGWILPASLALHTPVVLIGGGHGQYNCPERLTDPRLDLERVRWVLPSPFCRCGNMLHACNKMIPGFPEKFETALEEVLDLEAVAA